jgi:hypothetical protein
MPILPQQLWERLAAKQQRQLRQVLSQLVARRLLPMARKEAEHDTH